MFAVDESLSLFMCQGITVKFSSLHKTLKNNVKTRAQTCLSTMAGRGVEAGRVRLPPAW